MSYQKGFGQGTARPAVAKQSASHSNKSGEGKAPSSLEKITGMFPTEYENTFEVRITDEILAALQEHAAVGSYMKAFINVSKNSGKQYVTLAVKPFKAKQA